MIYSKIYEMNNNSDNEFEVIISVPFDEIIIEGQHIEKIDMHSTEPAKGKHVYVAVGASKHGESPRIKVGTGSANKPPNFSDWNQYSEFHFSSKGIELDKNSKHKPTNHEQAVANAIDARYYPLLQSNASGVLGDKELKNIMLTDRPNLGNNNPVIPVDVDGKQWYAEYDSDMGDIEKYSRAKPLMKVDSKKAYPIPDTIPKK